MTKLNQLISDFCPDGVPRAKLVEIASRNTGIAITALEMREIEDTAGEVRVFAAGSNNLLVNEASLGDRRPMRGPAVVVKSRGNIGFEFINGKFTHKSELWSYSFSGNEIDAKFAYYYLLTQSASLQNLARSKSVKLPQLSVADTDGLEIPWPAREVKSEIVRILDEFTLLEAELEAELEARKKQYEYYRNELLSFKHLGQGGGAVGDLV